MTNRNVYSSFSCMLESFLEYKESLGYCRSSYEGFLRDFGRFCSMNYPLERTLRRELVLSWAVRRDTEQQSGFRRRIAALREFGKFLSATTSETYIIPAGFAGTAPRYTPYIFTDNELRCLFQAADQLTLSRRSPRRHLILPVLLRLIYFCGLRPNEGRELKTADVDLDNGLLLIRHNKIRRECLVPMSGDMRIVCQSYATSLPSRSEHFFPNQAERPCSAKWLTSEFLKLWRSTDPTWDDNVRVRVYDLRHRFATAVMMNWIEDGHDLLNRLPYLSEYMGHTDLSATMYYIHLLPERLTKAITIDWERYSSMIPEVPPWES